MPPCMPLQHFNELLARVLDMLQREKNMCIYAETSMLILSIKITPDFIKLLSSSFLSVH